MQQFFLVNFVSPVKQIEPVRCLWKIIHHHDKVHPVSGTPPICERWRQSFRFFTLPVHTAHRAAAWCLFIPLWNSSVQNNAWEHIWRGSNIWEYILSWNSISINTQVGSRSSATPVGKASRALLSLRFIWFHIQRRGHLSVRPGVWYNRDSHDGSW